MKGVKKYSAYIIGGALVVIGFAIGMLYGRSSASKLAGNANANGTIARNFAGRSGSGMTIVAGKVMSRDSQSLTISLPNGNSQLVFYSTSTPVEKPAPVPLSSVATGSDILVSGTQNSDGSFTASSIQLRGSGQGPGGFVQ